VEQFRGWAKELFLMLNEAWTERSWGKIRRFESNALFNEHKTLLDKYKENGTINIIDQIGIKEVDLRAYSKDDHFEYLTVTLHAQLIDYIIYEHTRQVVRGDQNKIYHMLYTLTFARTLGVQSPNSLENVGITKCPNCGASMEQTASNECDYCHSIVTSGEYNWVLSSYTGQNMN
jgi:predicted lipid-binding transport protein (Tim44 family)